MELFNTGKHWPGGVLFSSEKEAGRSFFSFVRPAPDRPAAIQAWLAKHAKAVNSEGEGEGEKGEKGAKDEKEGDTKKGEECAGKEVEKEKKDAKEEGEVVKSEEGVEDETETAREADNAELQEEDKVTWLVASSVHKRHIGVVMLHSFRQVLPGRSQCHTGFLGFWVPEFLRTRCENLEVPHR